MGQASVGRTKATKTLKQLAEKGVLAWVGKGTNDPYQYYRLNESVHDSQLTARGRAVGCYGPDSCNRPLRHAKSHREMHSARPGTSPPTPRAPIRGRRIDQPAPADNNGTDKKPAGFVRRSRESGSAQFFHVHGVLIHPARRAYKTRARPGRSRPHKTDRFLHWLRLSIGSRDASTAREKDVSHRHR